MRRQKCSRARLVQMAKLVREHIPKASAGRWARRRLSVIFAVFVLQVPSGSSCRATRSSPARLPTVRSMAGSMAPAASYSSARYQASTAFRRAALVRLPLDRELQRVALSLRADAPGSIQQPQREPFAEIRQLVPVLKAARARLPCRSIWRSIQSSRLSTKREISASPVRSGALTAIPPPCGSTRR